MLLKQFIRFALYGIIALATFSNAWGAASAKSIEGVIKSVSVKARTISVLIKDKELKLINLNDKTKFKNSSGIKDIIAGDKISVTVVDDNGSSIALVVTKQIVKLPKGVTAISTSDLEKLVEQGPEKGNYLLLDARSASKYEEGSIRTAISLPYATLMSNPKKYLPKDKNKPLIFYCDGATCDLSAKSAVIAVKNGYKNVRLYPEGLPGWGKGDYCIDTSISHIQNGNLILIDLRTPEQFQKGHIPRAVNIPANEFKDAEEKFPEYKGASIVFYGDNIAAVREAISNVKDWGYNHASSFSGGVDEWTSKGLNLETGPSSDKIIYERKLSPNEMGFVEFKNILGTGKYLIIDVRTSEEYSKAHLPEALNIPLEEISKRVNELPKNKPILLHCSTGSRAEMAFDMLKGKGYDIKYVRATIEFKKDGKPVIGE